MPCWHVGPCGIGCDGYTANPQPQPVPVVPLVYPVPATGENPANLIYLYGEIKRLTAEKDAALLQIEDLKNEKEDINEKLKHYGLEPWPDGRSVYDGKRPWEQHIGMVISSLQAERDAANRLKDLYRGLLMSRRAMEPQHSREDHECPECIALADNAAQEILKELREQEKRVVSSPNGCQCLCHQETGPKACGCCHYPNAR